MNGKSKRWLDSLDKSLTIESYHPVHQDRHFLWKDWSAGKGKVALNYASLYRPCTSSIHRMVFGEFSPFSRQGTFSSSFWISFFGFNIVFIPYSTFKESVVSNKKKSYKLFLGMTCIPLAGPAFLDPSQSSAPEFARSIRISQRLLPSNFYR